MRARRLERGGRPDRPGTEDRVPRVAEPARAKAAAHLDVQVGQADVVSELARLTSIGAVVVGKVVLTETSPTPWNRFVLADPDGNQFCLQ